MNCISIGEIKPEGGSQIHKKDWIELIANHPALSTIPPKEGVNPFTREPTKFFAPSTHAQVLIADESVGSITWAEDDSDSLNVSALPDHESHVSDIATEIARVLNCRFFSKS